MADTARGRDEGFDMAAAVTRSLLGWGVVAGIFYLVVGVALALTRPGFDFGRHALSLLTLGDFGWAQTTNLILAGLMTLAAAAGVRRATDSTVASALIEVYGLCLVGSAIFPPDPMAGFPAGVPASEGSLSGVLHLAFGAVGFLCLAIAAFVVAGWFAKRGEVRQALYSRVSGAVVALGFIGGAALATSAVGVACLWIAVVTGWAWLAVTSVGLYRTVPHPDGAKAS
ncbi:DUF998 domain-containing protein [Allokutzneria sp. A3M-2-11 16]|uniref:DUF998 domain-containing protein n=1 Tax=Allokutzneria sp. A3M-2-11 16 TaxID=2962043 RepID=UPI0020B8A0DA|nr:DUF998 domain-containing protein [Allokutzneria sp. A3M-2-11 16]MCP3804347.1 DUF998 domain-containing protein [Allokutzneria sp. A3M-2-11 16]